MEECMSLDTSLACGEQLGEDFEEGKDNQELI